MRFDDVSSLMGNTRCVRVKVPEAAPAQLYLKLEGDNPTGSIKDRAGLYLIRDALASGRLRPGMRLLDASSGNMACAIAYFGRILGYEAKVFSNSKLTEDKKAFILYFGAELEVFGDFTIEGNRRCRELAQAEPDRYCFLDQLHNPVNPQAHYETTGPEILRDFPDLDIVVGSLGSGGSLAGTARYLKQERPQVRVVAVEAASGTRLPGTGAFDDGDYRTPFILSALESGLFDHVVKVDYDRAARRTLQLRDQGIFAGLQTGGVVEAAQRAAAELGSSGPVVGMSGDSGWKNMEKLGAL